MHVWQISVATFFSVFMFTAWYVVEKKRSNSLLASFIRGELTSEAEPELDIRQNVMRMMVGLFRPFLPGPQALEKWQVIIYRAGINNLKPEELYAVKWCAGVVMGIFMSLFFYPHLIWMATAGIFSGLLWYLLPGSVIAGKAKARQKKAQRDVLAYTGMLEKVCRAGLDMKAGVRKVADRMPGVLSAEFDRAYDQTRRMRFAEAMEDLKKRLGVRDVDMLVDALLQADRGANIVNILQDQAQRIRKSTMERYAQEAQKAPLKMLLPLFLFIFPPLFVLMLGPVLLNLKGVFIM